MAYTYDLSSAIGKVRLTIGDPVVNGSAYFMDEELQSLLDSSNGDQALASIAALRVWARRYASKKKEQIGDYTVDYGAMAKTMAGLADTLAEELGDESTDAECGEVSGDFTVRW